jgi:hypothetical protein
MNGRGTTGTYTETGTAADRMNKIYPKHLHRMSAPMSIGTLVNEYYMTKILRDMKLALGHSKVVSKLYLFSSNMPSSIALISGRTMPHTYFHQ